MNDPNILEFSDLVGPWSGGLSRIRVAVLLTKFDEKLFVRFAKIFLFDSLSEPHSIDDFTVETKSISAFLHTRSIDADFVKGFLENLKKSPYRISVNDKDYELPFTGIYRTAPRVSLNALHDPSLPGPLRFPSLNIVASDVLQNPSLDVSAIDAELFASDPPFNGLADLCHELGFDQRMLQSSMMPSIEVLVKAPVNLGPDSKLSEGQLLISILAPKTLDFTKIAMGLIFVPRYGRIRRTSVNAGLVIQDIGETYVKIRYEIADQSSLFVTVLVSYRGHHIARFHVAHPDRRPNPLAEIHDLFFGQKEWADLLKAPESRQKKDFAARFEAVVCIALGMIGLKTLGYGLFKELSDGPDILAKSDANDLYLVECTVGHPAKEGKIYNARDRVERLRSYAKDSGLIFRSIRGVIVVNLLSSEIESARAEASDFGLALFCKEELLEILRSAPNQRAVDADSISAAIDHKLSSRNARL